MNRLTIGAVIAGIAFVMELTMLPLLLSAIKEDFSLSVIELAWVFNAYAIAVAIAVCCSGFAGDVLDPRKLFIWGVSLFAMGSFLSASSDGLNALIVGRVVQGTGGGLFFPLVPILLTHASAGRAGRILMIWGALTGVSAAVLPMLGAAMLVGFGWSAIFVAFAAVSILALLFVALGQNRVDAFRTRRVPNYRKLLTIRGYWLLLFYVFVTYGCFSYYLFHFPVSWHSNGFDDTSISIFLSCVWLAFSGASFLLRNQIDGNGLRWGLLAAPGLLGLSFLVASFDVNGRVFQLLSAVLVGTGLACCNSPTTHLLLLISPKDLRATSSSLDIIFARGGSVLTVSLLATLGPFWVEMAVLVLALVATYSAIYFLYAIYLPD